MTRVAVVTGAARGIGAATARLLESQGWEVVALDIASPEGDAWRQVDVGDPDDVVAALLDVERVDGLVNNAAMQLFKSIADTTAQEWDDVQAQNLRAAFVTIKALRERLLSSNGAVVNVASIHAAATSPMIAAYAASKGGLVALTRAAALELAPAARVNAVLPGAVDTPALREGFARRADGESRLVGSTPLQRIGTPDDIAEAIAFLLDGDRSGFVTGQTLAVDGGVLARLASE